MKRRWAVLCILCLWVSVRVVAMENGGFDIMVSPGEAEELPSGWETQEDSVWENQWQDTEDGSTENDSQWGNQEYEGSFDENWEQNGVIWQENGNTWQENNVTGQWAQEGGNQWTGSSQGGSSSYPISNGDIWENEMTENIIQEPFTEPVKDAAPVSSQDPDVKKGQTKAAEEKAAKEKTAEEKAAKEKAAKEKAAKEKAAKEKAAKRKAAKEKAAKKKEAEERAAKEKALKEKEAKEKAAKEKALKEKETKERIAKEKTAEKAAKAKTAKAQEKEIQTSSNQGKDIQSSNTQYKDYPVFFVHEEVPQKETQPEILINSMGTFQILSLRMNGRECSWHWEGNTMVIEGSTKEKQNTIELLGISEGGRCIQMEPWTYSYKNDKLK